MHNRGRLRGLLYSVVLVLLRPETRYAVQLLRELVISEDVLCFIAHLTARHDIAGNISDVVSLPIDPITAIQIVPS